MMTDQCWGPWPSELLREMDINTLRYMLEDLKMQLEEYDIKIAMQSIMNAETEVDIAKKYVAIIEDTEILKDEEVEVLKSYKELEGKRQLLAEKKKMLAKKRTLLKEKEKAIFEQKREREELCARYREIWDKYFKT